MVRGAFSRDEIPGEHYSAPKRPHGGMSEMSSQVQVIEVPLERGESFLVEVSRPTTAGLVPASRPGSVAGRAGATLDAALSELRPVLGSLAEWARSAGPDTAEVEFGLKLTGGTSVIVASGSAEVNFTVRLTWSGGGR
jgi:hypothetical protein